MIEIYNFGKEWQVHTIYDGAYAGSFEAIMIHCIKTLRIPAHELQAAASMMQSQDHNASHFGVNRTLIYTFDKTTKKMEN